MILKNKLENWFDAGYISTVVAAERRKAAWLERAIPLDIYLGAPKEPIKGIRDVLFAEVVERLGAKRKPKTVKSALKLIIVNLYTAYTVNAPLRYSRSKDDYGHDERYGKLFFKYSRVVPLFDALGELGYVRQKIGYQFEGEANQTRAWATDKLLDLFHRFGMERIDISKEPKEELVILNIIKGEGKKGKKIRINYEDTELTRSCRGNLETYNNFISKQDIKLNIPGKAEASYTDIHNLYLQTVKGIIIPLYLDYRTTYLSSMDINIKLTDIYTITRSIRNTLGSLNGVDLNLYRSSAVEERVIPYVCVPAARESLDRFHQDIEKRVEEAGGWGPVMKTEVLIRKLKLADLGIHRMVFAIRYNYLHRVFNNGSFEQGGRFYGAFHLGTRKDWRKQYILINDSPTVELDYAAHHIRILYHLEGIHYADDPYAVLCGKPEERRIYKKILLTAINAESELATIRAFIKEARYDEEICCPLTHAYVKGLIDNFKKIHQPIAKHICSGIGVRLMNIDSRITEAILMRMTRENIPCLPVHDSYIVPAHHEGALRQAMIEEYEKIMGFKPVIG